MNTRKLLLTAGLLAGAALTLLGSGNAHAAPALVAVSENDRAVEYDTWHVWQDANYTNGAAHGTWLKDSTAQFRFKGTSVIWVTEKGNPMGMAQVWIDGVDKGTFDLYSATAQNKFSIQFRGLANTKHLLKIQVLGQKNPAAVSSYVFVDAFVANQQITEDSASAIQYNTWHGQKNLNAAGGAYRATRTPDATAKFIFTGSKVRWLTAKGPTYGKAEVLIDNVSKGVVDLYAPTQKWQAKFTYGGLSSGQHSIEIRVLGQKNPAATNSVVIVDGFGYQ